MARPIKNSCDYFPHDSGMRNHVKVKAIRNKFTNGYAIWAMILEYLTGCDGCEFEKSEIQFELLAGDFGFDSKEISELIEYCLKIEILFEKNGFIFSESLNERLAPVFEKRNKSKELSQQQLRRNGRFCNNNAEDTVVSVTETPQSKVKESKRDKRRKKAFIPPTLQEVEQYFLENGYTNAKKAFDYYSVSDWFDSKGTKVANWKQKMQGVWFKEENKIQTPTKKQRPDMTGWSEREIYCWRTRYEEGFADRYRSAEANQHIATKEEKTGRYKDYFDQTTLEFKPN